MFRWLSRRAKVGRYTVEKIGRETAIVSGNDTRVLISLETLADGKSVCVYKDKCQIERAEEDLPLSNFVTIAVSGLEKLGYRVELAK